MATEQKQSFEGGATRSAQAGRYDLVPSALLDVVARRLALGAQKHGENNWRSGGPEFRKATLSHAMKHLADYSEFGRQDDLDGLAANVAFLCHFAAEAEAEPKVGPLPGALGGLVESLRLRRRAGDPLERRDAHMLCEVCGLPIVETPGLNRYGWAHKVSSHGNAAASAAWGCVGAARPKGFHDARLTPTFFPVTPSPEAIKAAHAKVCSVEGMRITEVPHDAI